MKNILVIAKNNIIELCLIILFAFSVIGYVGKINTTINADAIGYYDYLPSIFIHQDIYRKHNPVQENESLYKRTNSLGVYVPYEDYSVDKYPCGTALLEMPFFLMAYYYVPADGSSTDGYQYSFQIMIVVAALFYLFLSILYIKKILKSYHIKPYIIFSIQVLLLFATSVTNYAYKDAGFSHVYSLFAISAFIYFTKKYFNSFHPSSFLIMCMLLGLIVILRQINILIVLFIPFVAGDWNTLKSGISYILKKYLTLFSGIIIFLSICFIQSVLWYLQTGHFILYSYQNESFDFSNPQLYNILFSYTKGLFIWTPVLFLSVLGLIIFLAKKQYYLFTSWTLFFLILTYILSSWWSWSYGCSYGLRAYIDYYPIFFILLAIGLNESKFYIQFIFYSIASFSIPLNMIQTYQYKESIINWIGMDKRNYWLVFLKTENKYKFLTWKKMNTHTNPIHRIKISDIFQEKNASNVIYESKCSEIPGIDKVKSITMQFDNTFNSNDDTYFILSFYNKSMNHSLYWHNPYLIHFVNQEFNHMQTGSYDFELNTNIPANADYSLKIELITGHEPVSLKNVKLWFYQ